MSTEFDLMLIFIFKIEDLSQQAQTLAAEKFRAPEMQNPADINSTVAEPIMEESEEEGEVTHYCQIINIHRGGNPLLSNYLYSQGR